MNRRDRILAAVSHQLVDRVPVSFDICSETLQKQTFDYYGIKDLGELYEKTGIEVFSVWNWPAVHPAYVGPARPEVDTYDATYGAWGKVGERVYPLAGKPPDEYRWPKVEDFDFSNLKNELWQIRDRDMTTASGHAGAGWLHHVQMRSYDYALYDVMDDGWMEEYIGRNREFLLAYFTALFDAAGGLIDIIRADEDVGGQQNMLISPALWRRWYKPLWTELFSLCRRNGAKVWLHSCGFCRDIVPDFIDMGADILNPIPPYVRGSDPVEMKAAFGAKLAFDGGVDQINVMVQGTPKDVEREVRLRLSQLSPGSGYILGPSQVLTSDVPFINLVAFINAAQKYCACPG
jgi:uroporphyrinogen decarboxylase